MGRDFGRRPWPVFRSPVSEVKSRLAPPATRNSVAQVSIRTTVADTSAIAGIRSNPQPGGVRSSCGEKGVGSDAARVPRRSGVAIRMKVSDQRLLALIASGDRAAFGEFYDRF